MSVHVCCIARALCEDYTNAMGLCVDCVNALGLWDCMKIAQMGNW